MPRIRYEVMRLRSATLDAINQVNEIIQEYAVIRDLIDAAIAGCRDASLWEEAGGRRVECQRRPGESGQSLGRRGGVCGYRR